MLPAEKLMLDSVTLGRAPPITGAVAEVVSRFALVYLDQHLIPKAATDLQEKALDLQQKLRRAQTTPPQVHSLQEAKVCSQALQTARIG